MTSKHPAVRCFLSSACSVVLLATAMAASGCGFEDPSSVGLRRGVLNLAYPDALHVGTAVWQAQLAEALPRDTLLQSDDLGPEARATLRLVQANALLHRLSSTLATTPEAPRSRLAVVLLGPVLWARFTLSEGTVEARFHVPGPGPDDVVLVTEAAVVEAIVDGQLTAVDALHKRLARLYGAPEAVAQARRWLGVPS